MFEDLRHYLAPSPYIEEKVIGKALDGQDLRLLLAAQFAAVVKNSEKTAHTHTSASAVTGSLM